MEWARSVNVHMGLTGTILWTELGMKATGNVELGWLARAISFGGEKNDRCTKVMNFEIQKNMDRAYSVKRQLGVPGTWYCTWYLG